MRPNEYATMFRVEETHWWYRALHQLIFQTLEAELPEWRNKRILDAGLRYRCNSATAGKPG